MTTPSQERSPLSISTALMLGLACLFGLPYLFPVDDGLSVSYAYGYSNRAAMLLLVAFTAGFALWTNGLGMTLPKLNTAAPPAFRGAGYAAVILAFLGALGIWLAAVPTVPYGEAQYFLDRYNMYRMFGNPYKAFTFYYGPIMFYLPVGIAWIAHCSLPNAYYASLAVEWPLGTWALWKTVTLASRGTRRGREIFLLCWLFFISSSQVMALTILLCDLPLPLCSQ